MPPLALPQMTPGHHLARLHYQQGCLGSGKDIEHICHANTETTVLAEPHLLQGRWPHSKGCSVWWVGPASRPIGWPALHNKDVCKHDLRAGGVNPADLETASSDHVIWWSTMKAGIKEAELRRETRWQECQLRRQQKTTFSTQQHPGQHFYLQRLQQILPL